MDQNAEQILASYQRKVWERIKKYLKNPRFPPAFEISKSHEKDNKFHWDLIKEYPLRKGKYLRPSLVLLTHEAITGNYDKAINTAAAMQLSEDWLLIHDDLEDNSKQRRGKPTLHRLYGPELAINAGDSIQIIMWKIIKDNINFLTPNIASMITDEFYSMLTRTAIGQTTEINMFKNKLNKFSDQDWFFIADGKTSYYTIAGPMRLGAIIAGVNQKQLDSITKFGLYLGRCFQLVDDILDITSNFAGLKKQRGNDIYEGKRTIMLSHLYNHLGKQEREKLVNIYSKPQDKKTKQDIKWILNKMKVCGSINYSKELAYDLKNRSLKIFKTDLKFMTNKTSRAKLETLIHFILERDH